MCIQGLGHLIGSQLKILKKKHSMNEIKPDFMKFTVKKLQISVHMTSFL
jgi:hypothetical protein